MSVQIFCPILIGLFVSLLLIFKGSLYVLDISKGKGTRYVSYKSFLLACVLFFHSFNSVSYRAGVFSFNQVHLISVSFHRL